ncbi:unnamed protein product [Parascedosporium putredinis]|uniref:Uncharacterized protein n=1 Tax=Parascedosporium putredinis TaxID=1442378 RepID=A0A9P1H3I7_9PEZI|nr:unnamed protein product [Parascedosporium putredinis]CAI7997053.1 unnamed protein product [Parascedosporium putredinis]
MARSTFNAVFARRVTAEYRDFRTPVTLDEWDDEDVQKQWPPDREDDFFKRVNNEIWPLDKDDEFWTRPEAIEFDPWEPVPTPSQKAKEQTAWAPVVDFIASLVELDDVDFEGKSQIPTTVLRVLNEKDGGPVRLHIYGFSLRSLYQAESNYHDIDEDEFYLATSPCLSSIRLLVPTHPDRAHGVDDGNRVCFNEDAVARMIEGLAPNLKFVSFNETYSRRRARHDYIWPGFFPSRPQDTSKRGKGSLETLALESGISTDPDSMRAWNDRTSLNFLRSLHLRTWDIDVPTLAVLSEIAEAQGLCSLRSLSLWIGGWPSEESEDRISEYRDTEISRFLKALRHLQSLELKGPFADKTFDTILHTHRRSLRKLRLIPERDPDVQMEPFVLTRDRVEALVRSCNQIQDLELRIPRSQGDEDEVRIYHALSELPLLDRLSLLLDCSNLRAAEEESDNTSGIADSFIREALINLNTSDRALAVDIFDALSLRNSPRLIRLYPDEVGNFGTDVREWSMIFIRNVLSRAWIRERDDMLSHEGGFRITEIEAKNRQNSYDSNVYFTAIDIDAKTYKIQLINYPALTT